jgi:hypothetical protein
VLDCAKELDLEPMSNPYQRTSRVDAFAKLHEPLRNEAQRVATAQGVGDLAAATRFCVATHSVRDPPGLLARALSLGNADREQWTVILVTRDAVLAGGSGDATGTHVFLLPLATLTLDDISSLEERGGPGWVSRLHRFPMAGRVSEPTWCIWTRPLRAMW